MDERSMPRYSLKPSLSTWIYALILSGLAGCSSLETAPPGPLATLAPDDAELTILTTDTTLSQLSRNPLDSSSSYSVTISSDLWGRLGTDFGLIEGIPSFTPAEEPRRDLWERLRGGFILPHRQHPKARAEAADYGGFQDHLDVVIDRAKPYLYYVLDEIEKRGMPSEIALLPIIESAYQPLAKSSGGAVGIWQFIPSTGKNYGLKQNFWYDGRRDIAASTNAAMNYLQKLNIDFNGDWLLTLAAYNCGEGAVMRAMKKNRAAGKPTDFWSLDLPRETEAYIPRLLGVTALVANPEEFGAELAYIPDEPYLTSIELDSQVNLKIAAQMADITPKEFKILNPGFIRGTSDPKGPHQLLLPLDKADIFNAKLASLEPGNLMSDEATEGDSLRKSAGKKKPAGKSAENARIQSAAVTDIPSGTSKPNGSPVDYQVREGDSLTRIAERFKITLDQLKEWNADKLTSDFLITGHILKLFIDPALAIEAIQ